jgi:hypothetical protein
MRRRLILLTALALVLLMVLALVFVAVSHRYAYEEPALTIDTVLTRLPEDAKVAQKELRKVRAAYAKLQPTQPYVVINTHANVVQYRTEDSVLLEGTCSTGTGGELVDSVTGRRWVFSTPRGVFKIDSKIKQPWWRKPDWAFIEENEKIPKSESERLDPAMMGDYAIGFGDGFFIHGTIYERLLGISVTHGCVRLGSEDIKRLYEKVKIGTPIYIF